MLRQPFSFAAAAACGLAFAGTTQAGSFYDYIIYDGQTVNHVSDDNAEFLIDRGGEEGILDVGDSIRGVVNFNAINSSAANLGGLTSNAELTGIFQIQVTGKIAQNDGSFLFTFGPDSEFDVADQVLGGSGNQNNALVLLWNDASNNFDFFTDVNTAENTARDGDFVWAIGFDNPDQAARVENGSIVSDNGEGWVAQGGEAFTAAAGVNPASLIGSANFAANLVGSGDGADSYILDQALGGFLAALFGADPDSLVQFIGNSTVNGASGALAQAGWDASSQTEFSFVAIPTPAAIGPGLVLMGMLFARRRRLAA